MKYQLYNFTDEVLKRVGCAINLTTKDVINFNESSDKNIIFLPEGLTDNEASSCQLVYQSADEDFDIKEFMNDLCNHSN